MKLLANCEIWENNIYFLSTQRRSILESEWNKHQYFSELKKLLTYEILAKCEIWEKKIKFLSTQPRSILESEERGLGPNLSFLKER